MNRYLDGHREVIANAANLDPNDHSPRAQQIREAAASSQDHLESWDRSHRRQS